MESTIWVQFSVAFISSGEPHSHIIGKKKKEKTRAGGEIGMQECCSFHERYGSKERSSYVQFFFMDSSDEITLSISCSTPCMLFRRAFDITFLRVRLSSDSYAPISCV